MYTILIVDDEKIERNGIKFLLEKQAEPFEIYEAPNGKAALEQLCSMRNQGKKIDILLTDLKMPFMDGIERSSQRRGVYIKNNYIQRV